MTFYVHVKLVIKFLQKCKKCWILAYIVWNPGFHLTFEISKDWKEQSTIDEILVDDNDCLPFTSNLAKMGNRRGKRSIRKSQWKKSRIVERALHIIRRGSLSRLVCDVVYTSKLFSFVCAKMMTPFDIHLYSTPVTIHMSSDINQIKRAFETNKTMNGTHNRISSSNGIE